MEKETPQNKPRRWWLAALLSIVQPGLGQIYNGQALKGMVLFLAIWVVLKPLVFALLVKHLSPATLAAAIFLGLAALAVVVADAIVGARRAGGSYRLRSYNRVLVYAGVFVAFVLVGQMDSWLVRRHIVQAFKIPSASMVPTLLIGDHLLIDKLHGREWYPRRGDVVVFEYPEDRTKDFVKRVEGIAGDTVEIKGKILYLNGRPVKDDHAVHLDGSIMPAGTSPRDNFGPVTVPADSVFVMGDNRDHTLDSRFFGFVHRRLVKGAAKCIYFSLDTRNGSVRWARIGKEIR